MGKDYKIIRKTLIDGTTFWNENTLEQLIEKVCFDTNRGPGLLYVLDNYSEISDFKDVEAYLKSIKYSPVDIIIIFRAVLNLTLGETNMFYQKNCS